MSMIRLQVELSSSGPSTKIHTSLDVARDALAHLRGLSSLQAHIGLATLEYQIFVAGSDNNYSSPLASKFGSEMLASVLY